jgi:cyanate permease
VSSALLGLEGFGGLKGWQWLFVLEAVPALVLAVATWFYLTDRPADATWLAAEEREWLIRRLGEEQRQREAVHDFTVWRALIDPKVLALALVYFGAVATNYGTAYFLPQIVKDFGLSNIATGFVSAIPYVVGSIGMVWFGYRSDRQMERKGHAAVAFACSAIGIGLSPLFADPVVKMLFLSIGAFGVFAVLPVFWTFPTAFLSGAAAAGGIAVINSVGNLAGFFGPFVMGALKDATGSYSAGLGVIAACAVVAMIVVLALHHDTRLEEAPVPSGADQRGMPPLARQT